jgi:hypothetical protein
MTPISSNSIISTLTMILSYTASQSNYPSQPYIASSSNYPSQSYTASASNYPKQSFVVSSSNYPSQSYTASPSNYPTITYYSVVPSISSMNSIGLSLSPSLTVSPTASSTYNSISYSSYATPTQSISPSVSSIHVSITNIDDLDTYITFQKKYLLIAGIPIGVLIIGLIIYINNMYKKNEKLKKIINDSITVVKKEAYHYPLGRFNVKNILTST